MAETAGPLARFGGAYDAHHAHLAMLIGRARPGADSACLADALLAPLAAPLLAHRLGGGISAERVKAALDELLAGVLGG
jgi:hypothetical protein